MHFQIMPTTLCNARCFYCYESNCVFETMQPTTAQATIVFIKKYIKNHPGENYSIDWFGGEPLLVPELIKTMATEILEYCNERSVNIHSEIVTNASKISGASIDFFRNIGISCVHISMDGMKEEYEKRKAFIDGKDYFEHAISCVRLLSQQGMQVMIRINVDKNNVSSCFQLIEYLTEVMPSEVEVHVAPLYGWGPNYLSPDEVIQVLKKLQLKIDSAGFKRTIRESIKSNYCRNSQQRNLVIKPNGDIIHCEHMYSENIAIIGNVYDGINHEVGWICDKCNNFLICKQGCKDEKKINCQECWKAIWRE